MREEAVNEEIGKEKKGRRGGELERGNKGDIEEGSKTRRKDVNVQVMQKKDDMKSGRGK